MEMSNEDPKIQRRSVSLPYDQELFRIRQLRPDCRGDHTASLPPRRLLGGLWKRSRLPTMLPVHTPRRASLAVLLLMRVAQASSITSFAPKWAG